MTEEGIRIEFSPERLKQKHEEMVNGFNVPEWVELNSCCGCGSKLRGRSIRGITLKLNAQNIGDISLEVLCTKCDLSYEVIYPDCCSTVADFASILQSDNSPICVQMPAHLIPFNRNNLLNAVISTGELPANAGKEPKAKE